ncbi:MAG: riboflavin kinase [Candidatus Levybacteria bacterium]|nr:riboflavin kinase [Candidatus Levybacteria bacterium]
MISFRGKVRKGQQRGKKLGFPTANIPLDLKIPEGIYISLVQLDDVEHPALTFIGSAETFGETTYQSETYLLNFDSDIYDQTMSITLLQKIRESEKFTSEEALIMKMEEDKAKAKKYFKDNPLE